MRARACGLVPFDIRRRPTRSQPPTSTASTPRISPGTRIPGRTANTSTADTIAPVRPSLPHPSSRHAPPEAGRAAIVSEAAPAGWEGAGASWMGGSRSQPPHTRPPPTGSTGADTPSAAAAGSADLHRLNARGQLDGNGDSWKDNTGQRWKAQPTGPAQPTGSAGAYASRPRRIRRPPPPPRRKSLHGIAERNKITIFALAER